MTTSREATGELSPCCPACGTIAALEPAFAGSEAVCSHCRPLSVWFRDQYGPEIRLGTSFAADLGLDSLDVAELLMQLEDRFDLALRDDEANRMQTIGDALAAIARARSGAATGP